METTWLDSGKILFRRVVVFSVPSVPNTQLQETTARILYDDHGLQEHTDYIFDEILGKIIDTSTDRIMIRVKEEEHYIMLKLHYDSN
jgi:hypothetical protein